LSSPLGPTNPGNGTKFKWRENLRQDLIEKGVYFFPLAAKPTLSQILKRRYGSWKSHCAKLPKDWRSEILIAKERLRAVRDSAIRKGLNV